MDKYFIIASDYLEQFNISSYWKTQLAYDYDEYIKWGTKRTRAIFFGWNNCQLEGAPFEQFRKS